MEVMDDGATMRKIIPPQSPEVSNSRVERSRLSSSLPTRSSYLYNKIVEIVLSDHICSHDY
jgi:hypothetical protein